MKILSITGTPCMDNCLLRLGFLCLICNASFMLISKSQLAESITLKVLHKYFDLQVVYIDKCSLPTEYEVVCSLTLVIKCRIVFTNIYR